MYLEERLRRKSNRLTAIGLPPCSKVKGALQTAAVFIGQITKHSEVTERE